MTPNKDDNKGCLSIFFPFSRTKKKHRPSQDNEAPPLEPELLPYRVRDDFLSPAEFSFYKVLSSLTGSRLTIQSKVRLADIFFVVRPNVNMSYFNRIAQLHLDFLICDSLTMKPLMGIELDDASHSRSKRQTRDQFVEDVFQVAELPLLRVPVQHEYNTREIAAQIAPLIKDKIGVQQTPLPVMKDQEDPIPVCPKCGIPMILRTVAKGDHKGKQFYGCQNFPQCREVRPVRVHDTA